MEFLEKIYSQEYFAPLLFGIIAILAVLFIIVLILALRDAKKKKGVVETGTNDAFAKVAEEPQEININVSAPETTEVKEEDEKKEDNVVSSVEPAPTGFENVEVPAPVAENNETPLTTEPTVEPSVEVPVQTVEEPQDIKVDETPVINNTENDLDSIAATLLSEYKKDEAKPEEKEEVSVQPNEFSSVGITPNTLPVEEETPVDMPNLSDIPVPQPVRVTETSTVIDSSKQNVDDIQTEEYSINK